MADTNPYKRPSKGLTATAEGYRDNDTGRTVTDDMVPGYPRDKSGRMFYSHRRGARAGRRTGRR